MAAPDSSRPLNDPFAAPPARVTVTEVRSVRRLPPTFSATVGRSCWPRLRAVGDDAEVGRRGLRGEAHRPDVQGEAGRDADAAAAVQPVGPGADVDGGLGRAAEDAGRRAGHDLHGRGADGRSGQGEEHGVVLPERAGLSRCMTRPPDRLFPGRGSCARVVPSRSRPTRPEVMACLALRRPFRVAPPRAEVATHVLPPRPPPVPRPRHDRHRRRDGRRHHGARRREPRRPGVPHQHVRLHRPRAGLELPREPGRLVHDRHLRVARPRPDRDLPARVVRAQRGRRALHRALEHLHARRLPGAGVLDRLRLPVPRRPVRPRGTPDRRPARAAAEPLRDEGRRPRPPDPRPPRRRRLRPAPPPAGPARACR